MKYCILCISSSFAVKKKSFPYFWFWLHSSFSYFLGMCYRRFAVFCVLFTLSTMYKTGFHSILLNYYDISSGTDSGLSLKILCTNLDKIHFETDSLIKLLHLSTFPERLINQCVTQLPTFPTHHWESGNHALFSAGTNLGSQFGVRFVQNAALSGPYTS